MITQAEYANFQRAYDWFNETLFSSQLPPLLITLQRKAKTRGYFSPDRFQRRGTSTVATHELALNPDHFTNRSDEEILSTLAHEMCHVWQQTLGTPPRSCYHDREWAAQMKTIGLQPSDTGQPGGKETGQHLSHYILAGGPFQRASKKLHRTGFHLLWQSVPPESTAVRAKKKASKTKYTCPDCGQNAWARPASHLICGDCQETLEEMVQPTPD